MDAVKSLLLIIVGSALVNNIILSQFQGLCPFLGVSKKTDTAVGMGVAVIFVITLSSFVTSLIYKFILVPLDITYLQTIAFILVIAALVQFVEMFAALTNVQSEYGILESVFNGVGTAVGFTIAIVLLSSIRESIEDNDIPFTFKGSPIVLITSGLMAIAFMGFAGLI